MKCRVLVWPLIAILVASSVSALAMEKPIYAKLTVPLFFDPEIPEDIDLINEALNEITRRKIGAEVELVPILYTSDSRKEAELFMLEKQGVEFDLINDALSDYPLIPLDDLLEAYGTGILDLFGEDWLNYMREDDALYKLPSVSDYASSLGISMRKDIIEKYELDYSNIETLADLDDLFAQIHELEPNLKLFCGYRVGSDFLVRYNSFDLISNIIFSVSEDDPGVLVNYYESDTYVDAITIIRKWYLEGYLPDNMAIQNINASQLVKSGQLFSYLTAYKPGIEYETSMSCGMEMITIPLRDTIVTNRSIHNRFWGISESCSNPGKAMQFLELLYTNSDVANLLLYGIEGVHYQFQRDGTIDTPPGIGADEVGYQNNMPWLIPNQLISNVWTGNDPDLWVLMEEYNNAAQLSVNLGFNFDDSAVAAENAELKAIVRKYNYGLSSGQIDLEIYHPQMLSELENAGLEKVLLEAQAQYSEWLDAKDGQK